MLLLSLPYLALTKIDHIPLRLLLACLVGAYLIAAAILPRWDRFQPPGALLGPGEQPRFFELLRLTAAAACQAMPPEVYLVPAVNAFVAGLTAADLPALAADPTAAAHRLDAAIDERKPPEMPDADFHLEFIAPAVGAALALAMVDAGWTMDTSPGQPFHLRKDGMDLLPFEVLPGLYDGTLTAAAWTERCAAAGIGALALAPAALGHQDG